MLKRIIKLRSPKFHDIPGWCLGQFIVSGTIYIDKLVVTRQAIIDGRVIMAIVKALDLATIHTVIF